MLLLFFLVLFHIIHAQCPSKSITLSSDEDIIAFGQNYPNCINFEDTITIGPSIDMATTRITNLNGLSNLRKIKGGLIVKNNPWLNDIKGLEQINEVGGDVELIIPASECQFISALVKAGSMNIGIAMDCFSEADFSFPNLIKVERDLRIRSLASKRIIFPELWKIGGNLYASSQNFVNENEFTKLNKIGGTMRLSTQAYKDYKYILPSIKSIKSIDLSYEVNLAGIGNLEQCEEIFISTQRPSILSSFKNIEHLKKLTLYSYSVSQIEAFASLKSVDDLILANQNGKNTSGSITHFDKLRKVNNLTLTDDLWLNTISKIDTIQHLSVSNVYRITDSLSLSANQESLSIEYTKLKKLNLHLKDTLKQLKIIGNEDLTDIEINSKSKSIKLIKIERNHKLQNLDFLNTLYPKNSKLSCLNNNNLTACVNDFVCALFHNDGQNNNFYGNGTDCTQKEIISACSKK